MSLLATAQTVKRVAKQAGGDGDSESSGFRDTKGESQEEIKMVRG